MLSFKPYSQSQSQLLPPTLNELVGKDHIARLLSHVVDEMDLSSIENTYSAIGQNAYHPKLLVKVLLYGYLSGTRSSRRLADKLYEDVVYSGLPAGRHRTFVRSLILERIN